MILRPRARTILFSALAFATAAGVTVYVNKLSELDPFASLRGRADAMNPIDIRFQDVDMKHWQGGKLITSGHFGRVDVHRDRQLYELYKISNGVYHTAESTFKYQGEHALWFSAAQRMEADRGVRVSGKNFDLKAPSFVYSAPMHLVVVQGPATGLLGGGQADVVNVRYNVVDDSFDTGKIHWQGKLAINMQQPDKSGPPSQGGQADDDSVRDWFIDSDSSKKEKNKEITDFTHVRATDKVSIFTSPKGTYDRKNEILVCEGPVKYRGEKANMICDHLVLYRKEKRMVATGNVVMYLKPEDKQVLDEKMEVPPFRPVVPDEISKERPPAPILTDKHSKDANDELRSTDNIKKYPTTIRSDKIVYWYKKGDRHAVCTGAPQAQQEFSEGRWRMAWTHEADYDGEKDTLTLISTSGQRDSRMKNSIGDDGIAERFVLSTKDGDDSFDSVKGSAIYKSLDEEANSNAAKAGADKKKGGDGKSPPPGKSSSGLSGPIGH
jgi:lipopolysaccharide export system protein LptA